MHRIAVVSLVLLLAGCGGGAPSSVVPADATMYLGVSAAEAERLLGPTSRADVEFERDVEPWLGERAAYFATTADEAGLVFDVEDEEAAEAFARKVTAAGPLRASAMIDGRLVLTSSRELLRAANAAEGGQALADSTRLDVAGEDEEDAPEILFALADPELFERRLETFGIADVPAPPADGPLTARVWDDVVEVSGVRRSPLAPSLANLPADARVAIASADLSSGDPLARGREAIEAQQRWPRGLDLEPLLRHAGAGTMAVQGERAQIVAAVDDEPALRRAVRALARALPRRRYIVDLGEVDGALRLLASPRITARPHFLITVDERLVVATGEPLGGSAQDLGDTARYKAAERRLGGAPSMLIGDLAVRDDGRGTLRISRAGG